MVTGANSLKSLRRIQRWMTEWTVMLKTPDGGIRFQLVNADSVDWDDEREYLEFMDWKAGVDAVKILNSLLAGTKAGNLSQEEIGTLLKKLVSMGGRIVAARFERGSVVGYFKGKKGTVDIDIHPHS